LHTLKASTALADICNDLTVQFDYAGGQARQTVQLVAPDSIARFGRRAQTREAPWIAVPRVAYEVAVRRLAHFSRPQWTVTVDGIKQPVDVGDDLLIDHPVLPIVAADAVSLRDWHLDAGTVSAQLSIAVGDSPVLRLAQQSGTFPAQTVAVGVQESASDRILTLRRAEDGTAIAGARVTIDGTTTRTSDSGGRVIFPAALLPPGQHTLAIVNEDGRTLTMTITVDANAGFAQTLHLSAVPALPSAASPTPPPEPPALSIVGDMPDGKVGDRVSVAYGASGGVPPYAFVVANGAVPDGMGAISAAGVISGTYEAAADYAFTVQVTDSTGATASVDDAVHVVDAGGAWVDITKPMYWTSSGYVWVFEAREWEVRETPSCGFASGLHPTDACIAACAGGTKLRVTLRSYGATDFTAPYYFSQFDNRVYVDSEGSGVDITTRADPGGQTYTDIVLPIAPITLTSQTLYATSRCIGNYPTDNYAFRKIEVFIP
jgi:hypothetical protein